MMVCEKMARLKRSAETLFRQRLRLVTLFLSASDGDRRATSVHASAESFDEAWAIAAARLGAAMAETRANGRWLRLDWVESREFLTFGKLRARLAQTKRNYFHQGLALDSRFERAFLAEELNANAMLYGGNAHDHCILNERNFAIYARAKYRGSPAPDFADDRAVFAFTTRGLFCDEDGETYELGASGLSGGRRLIERLDVEHVTALVRAGSGHLARQVGPDGRFVYGMHPCFDREIPTYNTLRHASSAYAMVEAWEVTQDPDLKAAIDRALDHLRHDLIRDTTLPDGTPASFLIEVGEEIKLGGNAVAILALSRHAKATGETRDLALLERLALGIRFMQDEASAAFVHVLNASDLSVKAAFRTIYYEGEAAFALMRLYDLTKDPRWLGMVERAFDHFIAAEHWRHHDHWLGYCVNELTQVRPQERYFRFGIQNIADYLDFVSTRITTFPTLLELMMAARDMLVRIGEQPALHHLLREIDLEAFRAALEYRAHYLLNGHFWPELAMFFAAPNRIAGSFFIRHHAFRVRIDDVEHYLSGFVAYRRHLAAGDALDRLIDDHEAREAAARTAGWTIGAVRDATGGRWVRLPEDSWKASGLCIHAPTMQPRRMVVARSAAGEFGVRPALIPGLSSPPSAIIAESAADVAHLGLPTLEVPSAEEAVIALGRHARSRMIGKMIGVTGSAGKTTTVAMLASALSAFGSTAATEHSANRPRGVAWNLASIPWDSEHVILEMAIGQMGRSARLARSHVAIITNILPAHLGSGGTLVDIARTKAAIFQSMEPGGIAIINRDMNEWAMAHDIARAQGRAVVHYGRHADSQFRLLDYDWATGRVFASIRGADLSFRLGSEGEHMAMNSLAVLAAVEALGYPLEPALERLSAFDPLPGRGPSLDLRMGSVEFTLIDESYNANPGSMRAALERLSRAKSDGRRIAVLGEMADLGADAAGYHTALAEEFAERPIDRYHVMGDLFDAFWQVLPNGRKGERAASLNDLKRILKADLADGDVVMVKGSHSTRVHLLVDWLKAQAER